MINEKGYITGRDATNTILRDSKMSFPNRWDGAFIDGHERNGGGAFCDINGKYAIRLMNNGRWRLETL